MSDTKPGFFASILRKIRDMMGEMKRVVWPTRKQAMNNTWVVLAFSALMAVTVGLIDVGMGALLNLIFGA